ncbi:MAG: hypothetical protein CVU65_16495, partial [Deltaproteobacteria bacterium HGW-Deltaproteobacteria-22]
MEERDPLIGQTLGNYHVESLLGAGAMGQVFLGIHPQIDRKVAVKVLNPGMHARSDMATRFLAEARAVNHINHPNIVQVFDFGTLPDGRLYLVMEFLTGEDLGQLLKRKGALSMQETLLMVRQIASGLDAAHETGIIHRDLKPDNVRIIDSKLGVTVKLLDFGIAKLVEPELQSGDRTNTGIIMGTPSYMSPEQAMGRVDEIGPASDIYSLGVMTYQMLSGRLPFEGDYVPQILVKHVSEPPTPITQFIPSFPIPVWQVLQKALDKNSGARPATAGDFFQELCGAVAAVEPSVTMQAHPSVEAGPATGEAGESGTTRTVVDSPFRRRKVVLFELVALAAVALVGAWVLSRIWVAQGSPWAAFVAVPGAAVIPGTAPAAPELLEPADAASFSPRNRAHMLRWQPVPGREAAAHEIELVRVAPAPKAFPAWRAPDGQAYLVIPWEALGADGGTFRWRVRQRDGTAWSAWRSFSFHPSALARIRADGVLRIGIEKIQHPPFVSWSPELGRYTGFDVELGELVAAELKVRVELVPQGWDQLLAASLPDPYDVVISAVSITPERCRLHGFSEPYLATGQRLASKTDRPTGPRDSFILGVQRNTTSEKLARATFKAADLRVFETNDLTFEAMFKGEVEALIMDDVLITSRTDTAAWKLVGELLSREGYGIMLPAGEPELKAAVDGILAAL